jgi:hypothetical protein
MSGIENNKGELHLEGEASGADANELTEHEQTILAITNHINKTEGLIAELKKLPQSERTLANIQKEGEELDKSLAEKKRLISERVVVKNQQGTWTEDRANINRGNKEAA